MLNETDDDQVGEGAGEPDDLDVMDVGDAFWERVADYLKKIGPIPEQEMPEDPTPLF